MLHPCQLIISRVQGMISISPGYNQSHIIKEDYKRNLILNHNISAMKKNSFLILSFFILSSCGPSLQVFSDRDRSINTGDYKSYGWIDIKSIETRNSDPRYYNELTDKRIRDAVNREMLAKGLSMTNENMQLKLHYHIIVEDKTTITTEPFGILYSPYWEGKMTGTYKYREGTLIIDIMDVRSNQLVWRGWATDVITDRTAKQPEEAINNAVKEIFKKFL